MNDKILVEELGPIFLKESDSRKRNCVKVECPSCNKYRIVLRANFIAYSTTKCNICKNMTHTKTSTRLYRTWSGMKQRCFNSKNCNFKDYGDRGITICSEWISSFEEFESWALSNGYEDHLTIDREDNDKGYSPDNCRWVTMEVQSGNKRMQSTNTSNYRCVVYDKRREKWYSNIIVKGKSIFLGYADTAVESAMSYNNYVTANNLNKKLNIIKE